MNRFRIWLTLPVAWLTVASLSAAPIPIRAPVSQGPISDALALRGVVPTTSMPRVQKLVMPDDSTLEVHHRIMQPVEVEETLNQTEYVPELREQIVKKDGQDVKVVVTVAVPVTRQVVVKKIVMVPTDKIRKESVSAKVCKFFTVTRDGKLETVEVRQAATQLKQPTAVLTSESAEVEPRHLELIKPGTIYVVLPPSKTLPPMPRFVTPQKLPDEKPKN